MAVLAGMIDRTLDPLNLRKVHAVVVLKLPFHPYRGAHGIDGQTDFLAFQILWRLDARLLVHRAHAVAEDARREYRQRDQLVMAGRALGEILRT